MNWPHSISKRRPHPAEIIARGVVKLIALAGLLVALVTILGCASRPRSTTRAVPTTPKWTTTARINNNASFWLTSAWRVEESQDLRNWRTVALFTNPPARWVTNSWTSTNPAAFFRVTRI